MGKFVWPGRRGEFLACAMRLSSAAEKAGAAFFRPSPVLCTDNGARIACAAHFVGERRTAGADLNAAANVSIECLSSLFDKAANQ